MSGFSVSAYGSILEVRNKPTSISLYIDNEFISQNKGLISLTPSKPSISVTHFFNGKKKKVEVFAKSGAVKMYFKIHIDGEYIGGDDF